MVRDELAESLEARGLYRRAARRWLECMMSCTTDTAREQIRIRRNRCLASIRKPVPERYDVMGVRQAADATLKRMGIDQPDGRIFRLHGEARQDLRLEAYLVRLADDDYSE
jgi:hypothetical protein